MNDIIRQFDEAYKNNDLFLFWEQELLLRTKIRKVNIGELNWAIDNPALLDFLMRSLYYSGRQNDFFAIIFSNMNNMSTVNWLINTSPSIIKEFLNFIPFYVINNRPVYNQLRFLINIYKNEYDDYYREIVNVLDLEVCNYLLSHTANPHLRTIIKKRQLLLNEQSNRLHYGIIKKKYKYINYPTIQGDKAQLLIKAIECIRASSASNFPDPYSSNRFNILLDAVNLVFRLGLIEDSLAILMDIYEDFLQKNRLVNVNEEQYITGRLNKILRKVIPMYALLFNPTNPYIAALDIYNKYFQPLMPDPASIYYLAIYETILESLHNNVKHGIYEIINQLNHIKNYRPYDAFYISHEDISNESQLGELQNTALERLKALPHESFVIIEFLRLLIKQQGSVNKKLATTILEIYIKLWNWIPDTMFLNQQLLIELGPLVDEKIRREAELIITGINEYSTDRLITDFNNKPALFKKRAGKTRLEIVTAKLLGVL